MNKLLIDNKTDYVGLIGANNRGKFVSVRDSGMNPKTVANNVRLHDENFSFYTSTLQKIAARPAEPLTYFTYLQDIDINYGGGFVDSSVYTKISWNGLMNEFRTIANNNSNVIPKVNAGLTQQKVEVYSYEIGYDLRFLELEKIKKLELQKSIQEIYQNAIMAGWDYFVQKIAYFGIDNTGGLFTSEEVLSTTVSLPTGQTYVDLTDAEMVAIFNNIFASYLTETNLNLNVLPDTILIPVALGANLSGRFNSLYTSTLRTYIAEHNLAVDESDGTISRIRIASRPGLETLGVGGKGRIVAYKKDSQFVRMDVPYPMQHFITLPNPTNFAYTTAFVGQVGAIQLPYNEANEFGVVTYWDITN